MDGTELWNLEQEEIDVVKLVCSLADRTHLKAFHGLPDNLSSLWAEDAVQKIVEAPIKQYRDKFLRVLEPVPKLPASPAPASPVEAASAEAEDPPAAASAAAAKPQGPSEEEKAEMSARAEMKRYIRLLPLKDLADIKAATAVVESPPDLCQEGLFNKTAVVVASASARACVRACMRACVQVNQESQGLAAGRHGSRHAAFAGLVDGFRTDLRIE